MSEEKYEKFAVVSNHEPPKLEDSSWDGDSAESQIRRWAGGPDKEEIDWNEYAKGFVWYDGDDRKNFSAYKLPHHKVVDGELKTSERGVIAAGNAVSGSRGGVDIPSGEMDRVRSHLATHYSQFDRTPPWVEESDNQEYKCECLDCGHIMETEEHCRDIECPECGGEMRRVDRPGGGYSLQDEEVWTRNDAEEWLKDNDFEYEGNVGGIEIPEVGSNWYNYRQEDPDNYDDFNRVKDEFGPEGNGIHVTFGIIEEDESGENNKKGDDNEEE
ncbi:MAG: hypothetical protein ACOC1X_00925 [Promethearchaeota archaeon]